MKRAFTLIELLVVIAIIAILAAILFPVFAQAKFMAKQASAISNEKQEALAFNMYLTDNDDIFQDRYNASPVTGPTPPYNSQNMIWSGYLMVYIKNQGVYLDPTADNFAAYAQDWPNRMTMPVGYNATATGWYNPGPPIDIHLCNLNQFHDTSKVVIYMSSQDGPVGSAYRGYLAQNEGSNIDGPGLSISDRLHQGTVVAMVDGHSKHYPITAIVGLAHLPVVCNDYSFYTGEWYLDTNAAHLKMNLQDPCIMDP